MNFTLIAYKADSVDTCRGCVMERFSSEHVIFGTEDREELLDKWSDYLCKNKNLEHGEDSYEITILVNGYDLYDLSDGEIPDVSYTEMANAASALGAEKDAAFKRGISLQKQADERARKARELASDRAELARLQAKLANS